MRSILFIVLTLLAFLATVVTHVAIYQPSQIFQENLVVLLYIDVALILVMMITVITLIVKLIIKSRRGVQGVRLSLRLSLVFLAMSLVPVSALYAFSVGGVFRGIESWFDTPLGEAFEEGIKFGQDVLGGEFARLEYIARDIAESDSAKQGSIPFLLEDFRLFRQLDGIAILQKNKEALEKSGDIFIDGITHYALFEQVEKKGLYLNIVGSGFNRVLQVAVLMSGPRQQLNVLMVSQALSSNIAEGLARIERGQKKYEELLVLRKSLKLSFTLTLSLSFVLILLVVIWLSLRLGKQLTYPLVQLSSAAESIGQRRPIRPLREENYIEEVVQINQSFNRMVKDLNDSENEIKERQQALHKSNAYLENLLSSLSTGVITFSVDEVLTRCNKAAEIYLGTNLKLFLDKPASGWHEVPALAVILKMLRNHSSGTQLKEDRMEGANGEALFLRVVSLSDHAGGGWLVMVDDISKPIRVEREATWEEASRRFVHEIKNPLTPIQLAAERLELKLKDRLESEDAMMLERMVETIVNQVRAMQEMVNSFRHYADQQRLPSDLVNWEELIMDVQRLYENQDVALNIEIEANLPSILGNAISLRQVLHNLFTNAMEALGGAKKLSQAKIDISLQQKNQHLFFVMEDNGGGISTASLLERIGQPYVTTKPLGTGLGLAFVRKTIERHDGEIFIANGKNGLRIEIIIPIASQFNESEKNQVE